MNILRIIYEYPEPWDSLRIVAWELPRAQVALGHKITVFCGGWPSRSKKKIREKGITVFSFPKQIKGLRLFLTTSPSVLVGYLVYRLFGKRVDIIHGHAHLPFFFRLYKFLFGWLDKTPYYFQLHVTAAGRQRETAGPLKFWTKFFEWSLHRLSDWLGVRVANKVFCVSESVRQEAIKYYRADSNKIVAIGSGINTDLFKSSGRSRHSKERQILFVGELNERKRPELLIETLPFLPLNYQSLIVGKGTPAYEKYLINLAHRLGVSHRVNLTGQVPYSEIPRLYQSSDVFVLPSKYEGFPKVVLEALACGLPVLSGGFRTTSCVDKYIHRIREFSPREVAHQIRQTVEFEEEAPLSSVRESLVKRELQLVRGGKKDRIRVCRLVKKYHCRGLFGLI